MEANDQDSVLPEEIESVNLRIDDDFLNSSEQRINTWGLGYKNGHIEPHDPNQNPIDLSFDFDNGSRLCIFFESGEWKSRYTDGNGEFQLSPDQFGQFFNTDYYKRFENALGTVWDLNNDDYYDLYDSVLDKKVNVGCPTECLTEDGEYKTGRYDKERSKEKNVGGKQIRTSSGRKIITFSDFGISKKDQAKYFVWPESDKEFRWSQWNDKNRLIARISFYHADSLCGLTYSLHDNPDENRGFLGYVLEQGGKKLPPVAWLSPIECQGAMRLSFIQKFNHNALKRIEKYLDIPTDEIFARLNNQEKITKEDIDRKKDLIRKNLPVLKDHRADTFVYN